MAVHRAGLAGIIIAMYTYPAGLIIVAAHNDWTPGVSALVTFCGWGWTLKSTLYLLFPAIVNRAM
ncbi:MAG: hypothetical protein ACREJQ_08090, partial [bacterium]